MEWVPRWLGVAHAALHRSFATRAFTAREGRRALRQSAARANLTLSRLCRAGWIGRLAHGWYVCVPSSAIRSAILRGWDRRFASADFAPILSVTVGELLDHFAPGRAAIALFGSAARGESRPESDLDLLVVAPFTSRGPVEWLAELRPVVDVAERLAYRQWSRTGAYHSVQLVPARPEDLEDPGLLFLDLTRDACLIEDPNGALRFALKKLKGGLSSSGAERRKDSQGGRYWVLGPPGAADEVETA